MQLSKATVNVLKNFSGISQSILLKPGSTVRTMSANATVFAHTDIAETMPVEAGIYDIPQFLNVLGLFSEPNVEFGDKYLTITEGDFEVMYEYCSPQLITSPPDKNIKFNADGSFVLLCNDYNTLLKGSAVMGLTDLFITETAGVYSLSLGDAKNSSSNQFSIKCDNSVEVSVPDQVYHVDMGNLRFIPADYTIEVSKKAVKFTRLGESLPLVYYVATVPAQGN